MDIFTMVNTYKAFEASERHLDGFERDGFIWAYDC